MSLASYISLIVITCQDLFCEIRSAFERRPEITRCDMAKAKTDDSVTQGFGELIEQCRTDSRVRNARLPFADLLRQSVHSGLAGYEVRKGTF